MPKPLPTIISLSEYRPSLPDSDRLYEVAVKTATGGAYQFFSSPGKVGHLTGGVALLVHVDLPVTQAPEVFLPGRVLGVRVPVHHELAPVLVLAVYGSNVAKERGPIQYAIEPWLQHNALLLGDWNGTTHQSDFTTIHPNRWAWLKGLEDSRRVVDLSRALSPTPPHTRVRRYQGSSYIDRVYSTRSLYPFLSLDVCETLNVTKCLCPGGTKCPDAHHFSDHQMVRVFISQSGHQCVRKPHNLLPFGERKK